MVWTIDRLCASIDLRTSRVSSQRCKPLSDLQLEHITQSCDSRITLVRKSKSAYGQTVEVPMAIYSDVELPIPFDDIETALDLG